MRLITARVNQGQAVLMGAMVIGVHAPNERHQSERTDGDRAAEDGDRAAEDGGDRWTEGELMC